MKKLGYTLNPHPTFQAKHKNYGQPIKIGTYLAFYNVLKIPMAFSSKGQTNRFRKAVSQ